MAFADALKHAGWTEFHKSVHYRKGSWEIVFDTSSWIEVRTKENPRVFDVPVPEASLEQWCVNLIEHLCKIEDERIRLRQTIEVLADSDSRNSVAKDALRFCYHRWLLKSQSSENKNSIYYCVVCRVEKRGAVDV